MHLLFRNIFIESKEIPSAWQRINVGSWAVISLLLDPTRVRHAKEPVSTLRMKRLEEYTYVESTINNTKSPLALSVN